MGKRSVKKDKNIYQLYREELGLTREAASELLEYISDDRIEKIESGRSEPHPDEILAMARGYKKPGLCNYYCSHECPIGQKTVPEIALKDLSQITLEALSMLNALDKEKERFIDITADSEISEHEMEDFLSIQEKLDRIARSADALRLWVQHQIAEGKMDGKAMENK